MLLSELIQILTKRVFRDNDAANVFREQQGHSLETDMNDRCKSMDEAIPAGE